MTTPYTPYFPIQLPALLKFTDASGNLVSQLYPVAPTPQLDNAQTGALSLNLAATNTLITEMNQVQQQILIYNQTTIPGLQAQITAIQTSGAVAIPQVNGYCLNGNTVVPINVAVANLISNTCSYNTALGTPTALANATLAEGPTLNTLPAYSQVSAMSALTGWISSSTTSASAINNLWLAYLDARAGITQALTQSNITCASIILNYQGVYNMNAQTISMYFYSSSIPAAFSASGNNSGTFKITDNYGNTYTQTFNLYNAVSTGSVILNIASSSLQQNSSYNAVLSYTFTSTTPSLGCNGSIPNTIVNNTSECPVTTAVATGPTGIQFTFTPTLINNVTYSISLINSSGTTSGSTVLATQTYTNPLAPVTGVFNNLTTRTLYFIRVSVITGNVTTTCPLISQTTS